MANNITVDTFNEVAVACLNAIQNSGAVVDQVYSGDPVWALLNSKGKKKIETGGDYIRTNLRRAKRSGGVSYAGAEAMTIAATDTLGYALFPWSQYGIPIFIDEATVLKNRGAKQIVNLVTDKVSEATDALQDMMTVDMYADGTGNSGKDLTGLAAAISATGTYGGIDRQTHTFWQAKTFDKNSASLSATGMKMIANAINTVRGPSGDPQKQGKVDLIVTTQDLYEAIEGLYDEKLRIPTSDLSLGKLGFESLKYKGCEITWSPNVTAGEVLLLSTASLGFTVMEGRDFAFSPFEKTLVNGIDGRVAWLLWMGNLTANECRRLGKLTEVAV
jgi:hypothetical protein